MVASSANIEAMMADLVGARHTLLPYQRRIVHDDSKLVCIQKSRRVGVTWTIAFKVVASRLMGLGGKGRTPRNAIYMSVTEDLGKEFIETCAAWCKRFRQAVEIVTREQLFGDEMLRVREIEFPPIDGEVYRVMAVSSSPSAVRGMGGDILIDEFGFHRDQRAIWKAAGPATTWGGQMIIWGTHNTDASVFNTGPVAMGRRRLEGNAREHDLAISLHTVTIDDAIADGLTERINEVSGQSLTREQFRKDCIARAGSIEAFNEEFLCIPSSDASSFFPYAITRSCVMHDDPRATKDASRFMADVRRRTAEIGCADLYVGCDVARKNDYFTISVGGDDRGTLRTLGILYVRDIRFNDQEGLLNRLMCLSLPIDGPRAARVRRLCIDATGMGMPLAERLHERHGVRVEPVNFTSKSKEAIFTAGRTRIDEKRATLPDCEVTLADLAGIRAVVMPGGGVRYQGTSSGSGNGHNDIATAWNLMCFAAHAPQDTIRSSELPGGVY